MKDPGETTRGRRVGSGPTLLNRANRYAHIDALRALSVMLVVLMHAGLRFVPGDSGVTMFFTISGFIITLLLLRERDRTGGFDWRGFYLRRVLKLAPPFLLIVVAPTLVYWVLGGAILPLAFGTQVAFSYNWAQIWLPGAFDGVLPGSTVVWSLAIEEQFYIVFAVVWIILVPIQRWRVTLIALTVASIVLSFATRASLSLDPETLLHAMRGTDSRLESISWGVLAAILFHSRVSHHTARSGSVFGQSWVLLLAIAVYGVSFAIPDGWAEVAFRPTLWSLAACLVILFGLAGGSSRVRPLVLALLAQRWIQLLGLSSYSIYLAHDELIHLGEWLLPDQAQLGAWIGAAAGVGVGIAVYALVERPIARVSKRVNTKRDVGPVGT